MGQVLGKSKPRVAFSPGFSYKLYPKQYMSCYMKWYTKEEMKRLRLLRGNKCELCSSKRLLEFAHVKPTGLKGAGRGKYVRVRDIKQHPTCYALLCHGCHEIKDRASGTWCNMKSKGGLKS